MLRLIIFCILRACALMRQQQQAEFWGVLNPSANPWAGLGWAAQAVVNTVNAASDIQVTTVIAVSGSRARDLLLDNGSHLFNLKVILTKIMRGENYPVFDVNSGFVVADGDENLIVEESPDTKNKPTGPWFVNVKWTPIETAVTNVQMMHWEKIKNQKPTKLTNWIIENVPYDWYDLETRERVYMKDASEFKIEALGFPAVVTAFTVTGTKAHTVLCGHSKVYNLEAILSRIMEGGSYKSSGRFGLQVTNTQEFGRGDGPWTIYATWTATPLKQRKYFHKLKNLKLRALTRWVIENVPWDYGRTAEMRKNLKNEIEFNFTSVE